MLTYVLFVSIILEHKELLEHMQFCIKTCLYDGPTKIT